MVPGPRVNVYESLATLEAEKVFEYDDDEEEDRPSLRYYKSDKVLGSLFRGIDEIVFLQELETSIRPPDSNTPNVLLSLWKFVEYETKLLIWDNHLSEARDIKEW